MADNRPAAPRTQPFDNLCSKNFFRPVPRSLIVGSVGAWERSASHAAHSHLMTRGRVVTFFLYVDSRNSAVPHMEPMPVDSLEDARLYAVKLLRNHDDVLRAQVFQDDDLVDEIAFQPAASPTWINSPTSRR